jgi:AcrR family transcriptional regulator
MSSTPSTPSPLPDGAVSASTAAARPVPAGPAGPALRADARRNRERLLAAATTAFSEHGAEAPLEDIARRAGVGIGTLYRHFPTRLALQEAVFRSQVESVCQRGRELITSPSAGEGFAAWLHALSAYLATKRGLSKALIANLGRDSELITSCSQIMKTTAEQLLERAQKAGDIRTDVSSMDVMRLVHGIAVATEQAPQDADRLLALMIDGLRS